MSVSVLNNSMIDKRAKYTLDKIPATPSLKLRLFVNNHTPTYADLESDYTQCSAAGYGPQALTGSNWTGGVSAGLADYTYPTVTFTFTAGGGQTVYGHYVTDETDNTVAWAELWDTPFAIPSGGGSVSVTLEWKDEECPGV